MINAIATWLHIIAVLIWIGGMLYTLFVLRPSLPVCEDKKFILVRTAMGKFFPLVWIAIFLLLLTGGYRAHKYIHSTAFDLKLVLYGAMVVVFSYIYFGLFKKLDSLPKEQKVQIVGKITNLIKLNFTLGLIIIFLIQITKYLGW